MTTHRQQGGPLRWHAAGMEPARRRAIDKMMAASQYAWVQMADPVMRAAYESGITGKKDAYAVAVNDFLNPPEICSVSLEQYTGHAGEPITLHVTDDFKVAGVRLVLLDIDGAPFEQGEAQEGREGLWRYKTRQTIPPFERLSLVITAFDIPGNTDKHTIHLLTGVNPRISQLTIAH